MRTNIVIDDELMKQALAASGVTTKRAVVELGLKSQGAIRALRSKLHWRAN